MKAKKQKNNPNLFQKLEKIEADKVRFKSVDISLVTSPTLFEAFYKPEQEFYFPVLNILRNQSLNNLIKAVVCIQVQEGLRISEVLNITGNCISSNGYILIKGLKGSSNRIIQPIFYREVWLSYMNDCNTIGSLFNRKFFYDLYKKVGLYDMVPRGTNASVTHMLRHSVIDEMMKVTNDLEDIRHAIGHKSVKSTEHYANKKNK